MTSTEILDQLQELGVTVRVNGPKVRLEPGSLVPPDLLAEIKEHKAEIIQELLPTYGDGEPPPQNRPPVTEQELRRLMDHLADPVKFDTWLDWALQHKDPSESDGPGNVNGS